MSWDFIYNAWQSKSFILKTLFIKCKIKTNLKVDIASYTPLAPPRMSLFDQFFKILMNNTKHTDQPTDQSKMKAPTSCSKSL